MLVQVAGCSYFKINTISPMNMESLQNIGKIHKYFIVHTPNGVFSLTDITVDSVNVSGNLEGAKEAIHYYDGRSYRYVKEEKDILHEVHFYLNEDAAKLEMGLSDIPLTDIKEVRIIEHDTGKTVATYIWASIGITAGVLVIVTIVYALTKSSCPYVYVDDGEVFVFEGEIFGGAIAKNLLRDDYMPLSSIKSKNGEFRIRISNELKERQYTDLAQLIVINHANNQQVLLDKSGNPQLLTMAIPPVKATSFNGENLLPTLVDKDSEVYFFNEPEFTKNGMVMKFDKPSNAENGKLILKGKNTLWFDYLFGEFLSKFGGSFDKWMGKQSQIPSSERLQKVLENDFPLSIYIKKNSEWELVDYLMTVGPLASREFVIPINLSEITGKEVEIKLETGFMFWEMDFAAMDYAENQDLKITQIKPTIAMGSGSKNWTSSLQKPDGEYMAQENIGEVTEMVFKAPPAHKNQSQTVFLHSRGYYELIRDFKGLPEVSALNKFKTPGYFSAFSRAKYLRALNREDEVASLKTTY